MNATIDPVLTGPKPGWFLGVFIFDDTCKGDDFLTGHHDAAASWWGRDVVLFKTADQEKGGEVKIHVFDSLMHVMVK